MHQEKINLVKNQIQSLKKSISSRNIKCIYLVSCGGSLATLYPIKYIVERESSSLSTQSYSANEFFNDPPRKLDNECLVILNSQSGGTKETVNSAMAAKEKGALTACFTTAPESPLVKTVDHSIFYYDNPLNPYPVILSIFPAVYQTTFAIIDAVEGTNKLNDMEDAMGKLENVFECEIDKHKSAAKEFAVKCKNQRLIYTLGSGLNYCIAYIATVCLIMESLWLDSSQLHAGEFFHGSFEAFDKETVAIALLGSGATRPLDERAVIFLQRKLDRLFVIDAKSFDLNMMPEWTRDYVSTLVLNRIVADYCDELSYLKGHPISSRRYMGVEKY